MWRFRVVTLHDVGRNPGTPPVLNGELDIRWPSGPPPNGLHCMHPPLPMTLLTLVSYSLLLPPNRALPPALPTPPRLAPTPCSICLTLRAAPLSSPFVPQVPAVPSCTGPAVGGGRCRRLQTMTVVGQRSQRQCTATGHRPKRVWYLHLPPLQKFPHDNAERDNSSGGGGSTTAPPWGSVIVLWTTPPPHTFQPNPLSWGI